MNTFFKVQVASILGSLADYASTILLVEIFNCWYLLANGTGNIFGGAIQFLLCRNWAFKLKNKTQKQVIRFTLVFAGNLILSAAGVYFFTNYLAMNYILSKTVVSILLGTTYNYLMQKKYVFA